ncbi:MAG: YebC/PmpR family DNA-binding transcriptional regulator [bacterium]|nr:YebC/PmpR family DNA-binding transcriptional regulator [bacterium]
MSRHSKWSKIKNQKGGADQKRAAMFTKLSRMVTIAARGGGDPAANFKLRLVIDTAKSASMPKDTIERAIAKGTGADKEGAQLIEETYEGFGPGGTAFIVEVVTDNKNRAYQEVRKAFMTHGGNLGSPGSVSWMFEHKGVIRLRTEEPKNKSTEEMEMQLIDAGADDIAIEEEGITIYTKSDELKAVEEKIRALGFTPESAGLEWVAKEKVAQSVIPSEAEGSRAQLEALQDALDEMEDASEYYTNAV